MRRCTYHLNYPPEPAPGNTKKNYLFIQREDKFSVVRPREVAEKFIVKPTSNGEGTVHRYSTYESQLVMYFHLRNEKPFIRLTDRHVHRNEWLLNLGSRTSHLPFRECRHTDGNIHVVSWAMSGYYNSYEVDHWELAPATLAEHERFEWRV